MDSHVTLFIFQYMLQQSIPHHYHSNSRMELNHHRANLHIEKTYAQLGVFSDMMMEGDYFMINDIKQHEFR